MCAQPRGTSETLGSDVPQGGPKSVALFQSGLVSPVTLYLHTHTHTHTHMLQQASDSFKIGVWIKISRGETSSEDKKQLQRASDFLIEILGSKASEKSLYCMHQQTAEWVRKL